MVEQVWDKSLKNFLVRMQIHLVDKKYLRLKSE